MGMNSARRMFQTFEIKVELTIEIAALKANVYSCCGLHSPHRYSYVMLCEIHVESDGNIKSYIFLQQVSADCRSVKHLLTYPYL